MANFVTCLRIIFSIALLFFPALSLPFYVFYTAAGITDMVDGTIARKTNSVSEFGSRFDTAADIVFITVCMIKLFPVLTIHFYIYIWTAIIALIKIINITAGYVMNKKFTSIHSFMNKITGALLFVIPFTLNIIELKYRSALVCAAASFAAVQEGYYIIKSKPNE